MAPAAAPLVILALGVALAGAGYAPAPRPPTRAPPPAPVASPQCGTLAGTTLESWSGHPVHAFRGVRYATPPTGHLRFKAPAPLKPWTGTVNAFEDGAACPQPNGDYYGQTSEDCLFLNVYTRGLTGEKPVIVFFHPGGFFAQTAKSAYFGPHYLLDHDVVLVTVNYRLGALGFLSTGDAASTGNFGLKDQVAALKWVKKNIAAFGGSPDQVTIAGNNVGAASVFLHMVSPQSKGLFHKVIAMSGGVTAKWVVNKEPLKLAKRLGKLCDCDTSSSQKLVACLRQLPAQSLADHYVSLREWYHDPAIVFGAVVEKDGGFLTDNPASLIASEHFTQVPVVMGITKNEYEGRATAIMSNGTLKDDLEAHWEQLAPIIFYYERGTEKSKALSKELRQFYFAGGPVNTKGVSKIYSDALIISGAEQTAKLLAKYSKEPVYFYFSQYPGRYSYNYKQGTKEPFGVMNMDDLLYLFTYPQRFPIFKATDPEAQAVHTYTSMWSNFAHSGDPTPSNADLEWKPLSPEHLSHLNIEKSCSIKPGLPYKDRVDLWEKHFPAVPCTAQEHGHEHDHEHGHEHHKLHSYPPVEPHY